MDRSSEELTVDLLALGRELVAERQRAAELAEENAFLRDKLAEVFEDWLDAQRELDRVRRRTGHRNGWRVRRASWWRRWLG